MLLTLLSVGFAANPQFERVDFISEERGTWVNYELPTFSTYPTRGTIRWLNQLKLVWSGPWENTYVGTSLASQSLVYEHELSIPKFYVTGGIQSQLFLPNGIMFGTAWRHQGLRLGMGLTATSEATWSRIAYQHWTILPTIGIGYGRD